MRRNFINATVPDYVTHAPEAGRFGVRAHG